MPSNKSTIAGSFTEIAPTVLAKNRIELEPSHAQCVALQSLSAGDVITINTRDSCYRMQVIDAPARRVLITGGTLFPGSTEVEVIGAADGSGVRSGFVAEGMQLELSTARGPILTSMVVTLSVDSGAASP